MLEPYLEDVQVIAITKADPLREGAIYILSNTNPLVSAKGIEFLVTHLGDIDNSASERLTMASSILRGSRRSAVVDRVINLVSLDADAGVKNGVLLQLGRLKTRDEMANKFISNSLMSSEVATCRAALKAIDYMDQNSQMLFVQQLENIATQSERTEMRAEAEVILRRLGVN